MDEAVRYKRWRAASGDDANKQAQAILTDQARQQSRGANDFKSELAECAQLVELLGGEEQLDNLADLKDNKLNPVLDRLSRTIDVFGADPSNLISPRSIDDIREALFGKPAGGETAGVHAGGVYALRRDTLGLRQERERLRKEQSALFGDVDAANNAVAQSAQERTAALANQMEQGLTAGWRQLMIFGSGCSALFLWLAWVIAKGNRAQVDALESARAEAETARRTSQKLMQEQLAVAAELAAAHMGLQASEQRFRALSTSAPIGIFESDDAGRCLYANPQSLALMGMSMNDVIGDGWVRAVHPEDCESVMKEWGDTARSGQEFSREFRFRTPAGDVRWVYSHSIAIRSDKGGIAGHVGTIEDITERKRAETQLAATNASLCAEIEGRKKIEEDLRHARQVAEAANAAKSTFLANMSHELRTPLNAVIGYSEMLEEMATDDGNTEYIADLQKIRGAGKHLLELINAVLDLSKVEAGKMELYIESFPVGRLLADVTVLIEPLALKNNNTVTVTCAPELATISADATKLRQTLFNLLSNAAKFTHDGTITVDARVEIEEGCKWVVIDVKDTGIGITPEQIAKLFQPFQQADASTTRKYGGTGLGLTISRQFCRMMGGELSVESHAGSGTTFTVRLPMTQSVPARAASVPRQPASTHRPPSGITKLVLPTKVLVIDDDETDGARTARAQFIRNSDATCICRAAANPDWRWPTNYGPISSSWM